MGLPKKSMKFPVRLNIEGLEPRQLLSAANFSAHADFKHPPHLSHVPSQVQGYTPAQIRHSYGFDQVAGDGSGQTIAIVDAYRHPSIAADLAAFDLKFGIAAPPSFKAVNQTGGPDSTVKVNSGWASEIAMDVEWAHAIAPNAGILLVETKSDDLSDLMAGVDYARNVTGVSVVSLSWGSSEFRGQKAFDATLTTPTGHQGVTFVAASGDEGSGAGAEWPATSPGVLAVGGTSLKTSGSDGTYSSEASWNRSTGGVSRYEKAPAYQGILQSGGMRTSPDVAYNADPNTGFAVYSSIRDGGVVGWSVLGGTSAGTPQWAAQVALANQLRAAAGFSSLDGAAGTLPALYSLYSPPDTAGFATYTVDFHDIVQGRSTGRQRPGTGYDEVTGLGSPDAPQIIYALVHADGHIAVSNPVPTPKTTRLTARHSVAFASSDSTADVSVHRTVPAVIAVKVVEQGVGQAVSQLNPGATTASVIWANAARAILPVYVTTQFHQPSAAFIHAPVKVQLNSTELANPESEPTPQTVASIAGDVSNSVAVASRLAESAIPMFWNLGQSLPMASFADAMADFAYESSALGTAVNQVSTHVRAWTVTVSMVAVDLILIGYWHAGRQSVRGNAKDRTLQSRFCLTTIRQ